MSSITPLLLVLIIVAGIIAFTNVFIRKGPNQVLIRTSVTLSLVGCYLLWAITYLAQLHPLMAPRRTPGEVHG